LYQQPITKAAHINRTKLWNKLHNTKTKNENTVSSSGPKEFSLVILNYVIRVLNIDYWVKDEFTQ